MLSLNDNFNRLYIKSFLSAHRRGINERLLDLGCGTCPFKDLYESRFDMAVASDIELRQQSVDVLSSVESLPFKDESFDLVLLAEVIEHVGDDLAALREIHRVLAPGGSLILTWPSMFKMHELPTDFWRHTEFGMSLRLSEAGFDVCKIKRRGDFIAVFTNLFGEAVSLAFKSLTRLPAVGVIFRPLSKLVDSILSAIYWIVAQLQYRMGHLNPEKVGDRLQGFRGRLALYTLGYCVWARKQGP